jgi:hypothetical protein
MATARSNETIGSVASWATLSSAERTASPCADPVSLAFSNRLFFALRLALLLLLSSRCCAASTSALTCSTYLRLDHGVRVAPISKNPMPEEDSARARGSPKEINEVGMSSNAVHKPGTVGQQNVNASIMPIINIYCLLIMDFKACCI